MTCSYGVYNMEVVMSDGHMEEKILFFLYAPDTGVPKLRFLYASGKEGFKKKIGSVNKDFQVPDRLQTADQHAR